MKKFATLLIVSLILASCGAPETTLSDLLKRETEIQNEIKSLNDSLILIQKRIAEIKTDSGNPEVSNTPIKAITLAAGTFSHTVDIQGVISTKHNVTLSAENGGKVLRVLVKEGQKVVQGQRLIELDGSVIQSNLNELRTRLALAKEIFEKQERLYKQEVGTQIQYLQAKNNYEALQKQESAILSTVEKFTLRSPINGTVDAVMVNAGELTAPGLPAIRVVDLKELEAVADISERYVGSMKVGDAVSVYFPVLRDTITATISAVSQVINPNNRTFSIRVPLKAGDSRLKPNLMAIIQITDFKKTDAIMIPANLVQTRGSEKYVFVAIPDGNDFKAERRNIITGLSSGGYIYVESGLAVGDKVISDGYLSVESGDKVQIN